MQSECACRLGMALVRGRKLTAPLLRAVLKERSRGEWMPEYIPQSHVPPSGEHAADTMSERGTRVSLRMIMEHVPNWCVNSNAESIQDAAMHDDASVCSFVLTLASS